MTSCNEHHKCLDENGVGKCSVPAWSGGVPAGFCDEPAYGEPTDAGRRRYAEYVPYLACYAHGGPHPNTKLDAAGGSDGDK